MCEKKKKHKKINEIKSRCELKITFLRQWYAYNNMRTEWCRCAKTHTIGKKIVKTCRSALENSEIRS